MSFTRRNFLRSSAAMAITGSTGLATALSSFSAKAADTSGYKALVCVFLKGGLDCHDTVIPYDTGSYSQFANARSSLINNYRNIGGTSSRERDALLPLTPTNAADLVGRKYGLPPKLDSMHTLFGNGRAAIIGNVGPLIEPLNRTTFQDRTGTRPDQLFSHNDQQATWMSLRPEGQATGWGGQFADAANRSGANGNPVFSAISMAGNEVFLIGQETQQYQLNPRSGAQTIRDLELQSLRGSGRNSERLQQILEEHYDANGNTSNNLFERDLINSTRRAISANTRFNEAREAGVGISTVFPEGGLGDQLRTVAETIALRDLLNVNRQVFIVTMGGFDSHSDQAQNLPARQTAVTQSIAAFFEATKDIGVENDVTTFTASDFGRTLTANGDGTDHGWGGHHFVVGGAVNGGAIYGEMPQSGLEHAQDSNNGRLIPTTSIEQFAAPLGRWFGLNEAELTDALPSLGNFNAPPLTFI